jgi:hypothetical protein
MGGYVRGIWFGTSTCNRGRVISSSNYFVPLQLCSYNFCSCPLFSIVMEVLCRLPVVTEQLRRGPQQAALTPQPPLLPAVTPQPAVTPPQPAVMLPQPAVTRQHTPVIGFPAKYANASDF